MHLPRRPTASSPTGLIPTLVFPSPSNPDIEFRLLVETGTIYHQIDGTFTGGNVLGYEIFNTVTNTVIQSADLDWNLGAAPETVASVMTAFVSDSLGVMTDTIDAWNLFDGTSLLGAAATLGDAHFNSSSELVIDLMDGSNAVIGQLRLTGTNFDPSYPETASTVTKVELLDSSSTVLQAVDYALDPHSLANFSYGLLKYGVSGVGNDELLTAIISQFDDTIHGGVADYSYATAGVTVHLNDGAAEANSAVSTSADAHIGQDALVNVQGVNGSEFNDDIIGDGGNNFLAGRAGNDTITAGAGSDIADGGAGNDTLDGGAGDDLIFAGTGTDTIHGGLQDGNLLKDVLSYSAITVPAGTGSETYGQSSGDFTQGIAVTFTSATAGTVTEALAIDDTFDGIEGVWGSRFGDTFTGFSGGGNVFVGLAGADTFTGGNGAADTVVYDNDVYDARYFPFATTGQGVGVIVNLGGTGASYSTSHTFFNTATNTLDPSSVTVTVGTAIDSFGDTDTLTNIENIDGTFFSDIIIGGDGVNKLVGKEGADLFVGGQGNDVIWGGIEGNNFISDNDVADYGLENGTIVGQPTKGIVATIAASGIATVTDTFGTKDTLHGIFEIRGTGRNDTMKGNADTNRFYVGGGDDRITSGGAPAGFGNQDEVSYLTASVPADGIDYDATRLVGQIKTNGLTGIWGTDTLLGFTAGIWLEATTNNDILKGGAATDIFYASLGADIIDGRGGVNALIYSDSLTTGGVTVNATGAGTASTVRTGTVLEDNVLAANVTDDTTDSYANIQIFGGSRFNDTFNGNSANETFAGFGGDDTYNGGGGIDTVSFLFDDFFGATQGVQANIGSTPVGIWAANTILDGFGGTDTTTGIKNLIGSFFDDILIGSSDISNANNRLDGSDGDDTVIGGLGNDVLIGGANNQVIAGLNRHGDLVSYLGTVGNVTVNLALTTAQNTGGAGIDTISGFESVEGGDGNDTLRGTAASNYLIGGAGNDTLFGLGGDDDIKGDTGDDLIVGGAGADQLNGGADVDTVSYAGSAARVTVDLSLQDGITVQSSTGDANGDLLVGFENIIGSSFGDILTGDDTANVLSGGGGADTIDARDGDDIVIGGAGADILFGGDNSVGPVGDTVSYATSALGVKVDLERVSTGPGVGLAQVALNAAIGADDAAGDRLSGFENITGSAMGDILLGDANANILIGSAGNDTLDGRGGIDSLNGGLGNDTLIGGVGVDTLDGGDGIDTVNYAGSLAGVNINLNNQGPLDTQVSPGSDADGDQLRNIENVTGSSQNDTLTGNDLANRIDGGSGDDTIQGGLGNDVLIGGAGTDMLLYLSLLAGIGAAGQIGVTVNLAANTATGAGGTDTISGFENVTGSDFNDTLTGTGGVNAINGGNGDDLVKGGAGADILLGGSNLIGGDTVSYAGSTVKVTVDLNVQDGFTAQTSTGDANGDILSGFENIIGSSFNDVISGNASDNIIEGGAGNDILDAGTNGNDTVSYTSAAAGVTVSLLLSTAQNTVGAGTDTLFSFENILGSAFNDKLTADNGANILTGALGNDTLTGGLGADKFVFNTGLNALTNKDTITDFSIAQGDKIVLENAVFTALGLGTGTLSAAAFALSTNVPANDDRIIYNTTTGTLTYDSNGALAGGQTVFAVLQGAPVGLSNTDFIVI